MAAVPLPSLLLELADGLGPEYRIERASWNGDLLIPCIRWVDGHCAADVRRLVADLTRDVGDDGWRAAGVAPRGHGWAYDRRYRAATLMTVMDSHPGLTAAELRATDLSAVDPGACAVWSGALEGVTSWKDLTRPTGMSEYVIRHLRTLHQQHTGRCSALRVAAVA